MIPRVAIDARHLEESAPVRPADFRATLEGFTGPLPPPHYFEHAIRIGPGAEGSLEVTGGYPGPATPVWRERFALTDAHLDWLFGIMTEQGVFEAEWPQRAEIPVGSGSQKLTVVADGRTVVIAPFVVAEREASASHVLTAVRALLPAGLWDALQARREAHLHQPVNLPPMAPPGARAAGDLFEENHVAIATLLGTPIAGATLMAVNSIRLGRVPSAIVFLGFGAVLSAIEIYYTLAVAATGSHGSNLFSLVVGIIGALVMRTIAGWLQGEEVGNHVRAGGSTAPGFAALLIGGAWLVGLFVVILALGLLPSQ